MAPSEKSSPDAIEIELIRSLYDGLLPSLVMSAGFLLCGALILDRSGDPLLTAPYVAGVLASLVRVGICWGDRARAKASGIDLSEALRLERRFAFTYILFAAMIGMFTARTLALPDQALDKLTVCLVIGYAAGVAAGTSLRPPIAI